MMTDHDQSSCFYHWASRASGALAHWHCQQAGRHRAGCPESRKAGGGGRGDPRAPAVRPMSSRSNLFSRFHQAGVCQSHKEFGVTEVLVNNAGMTKDGLAVRMKPEDWNSCWIRT